VYWMRAYLSRGFNSSGHTSTDHLGISGIQHVPKVSLIDRRCHGTGNNFGENGGGEYFLLKRKFCNFKEKHENPKGSNKAFINIRIISFLGCDDGRGSNDRFQGFDGRFHQEIGSCGSLNNRASFLNIPKGLFHPCVYKGPVQSMQRIAADCTISPLAT
jgi:hypothetical protein